MTVEFISSQPASPNIEKTQLNNRRETDPVIQGNNLETKIDVPKKEDLEKIINSLNDFIKPTNTHLKFEFHEELKEYYVTIVDNITETVVREIPSKRLLDIYSAMNDFLGLIVDKKI